MIRDPLTAWASSIMIRMEEVATEKIKWRECFVSSEVGLRTVRVQAASKSYPAYHPQIENLKGNF